MTSLRTMEGLNLEYVTTHFGEKAANKLKQEAQQFMETGKMQLNNGYLQLTKEGKLFADGIAAELFTA
jgi:oxygen-independent coproporphyrinogen-3 oxidase